MVRSFLDKERERKVGKKKKKKTLPLIKHSQAPELKSPGN
jgi:hypothetical protein